MPRVRFAPGTKRSSDHRKHTTKLPKSQRQVRTCIGQTQKGLPCKNPVARSKGCRYYCHIHSRTPRKEYCKDQRECEYPELKYPCRVALTTIYNDDEWNDYARLVMARRSE